MLASKEAGLQIKAENWVYFHVSISNYRTELLVRFSMVTELWIEIQDDLNKTKYDYIFTSSMTEYTSLFTY